MSHHSQHRLSTICMTYHLKDDFHILVGFILNRDYNSKREFVNGKSDHHARTRYTNKSNDRNR